MTGAGPDPLDTALEKHTHTLTSKKHDNEFSLKLEQFAALKMDTMKVVLVGIRVKAGS